jgi:hypothetical protein
LATEYETLFNFCIDVISTSWHPPTTIVSQYLFAHDALATSSNTTALHGASRMWASKSIVVEILFSVFLASFGITCFTPCRDLFRRTIFIGGYSICKLKNTRGKNRD